MVSDSNQRLIVADWPQYFYIEFLYLPPETIGVPPPWREPLYRLEQPEKQRGTSGGCGLLGRPLQGC